MQAIITEFRGATERKPSRIIAKCSSGQIVFSLTHATGTEAQNHMEAAKKLRDAMGWQGEMVQGGTKGGYAFVFLPK